MKNRILSALACLVLSSCVTGADGKRHFNPVAWSGEHRGQIGETTTLLLGKVVDVTVQGLLNAAVSSQDAGNKADFADSLAYGFRTLPPGAYVTDRDIKNVFAIWAPDKPHWAEVAVKVSGEVQKLSDPNSRTPEMVASALNEAAAEIRVMTTTGA